MKTIEDISEAILQRNAAKALLLIEEKDFDIDGKDSLGLSLLHRASQTGQLEIISILLNYGANPNIQDSHGSTPLILASAEPVLDAIDILLKNGANVNARDDRGFTALHSAAGHYYHETPQIVSLLLKKGANPNLQSSQHRFTPLHEVEGIDIVKMLVDNGADIDARDYLNRTPQVAAIEDERFEESELLALLQKNREHETGCI